MLTNSTETTLMAWYPHEVMVRLAKSVGKKMFELLYQYFKKSIYVYA